MWLVGIMLLKDLTWWRNKKFKLVVSAARASYDIPVCLHLLLVVVIMILLFTHHRLQVTTLYPTCSCLQHLSISLTSTQIACSYRLNINRWYQVQVHGETYRTSTMFSHIDQSSWRLVYMVTLCMWKAI